MNRPHLIQRIEGAAVAVLAVVAVVVVAPAWWWVPLAAFLLFDLSALGYLRSPRLGSATYNAVHTYVWPVLLAAAAVVLRETAAVSWLTVAAASWAFHVGVDRALGYGLKLPDAFTHTHLGWIGKDRGRDAYAGSASGASD